MTGGEFITTAPDSHFVLIPCPECGQVAAYKKRENATGCTEWAAGCPACGKWTAWHQIRHRVQCEWNGRQRPKWETD